MKPGHGWKKIAVLYRATEPQQSEYHIAMEDGCDLLVALCMMAGIVNEYLVRLKDQVRARDAEAQEKKV